MDFKSIAHYTLKTNITAACKYMICNLSSSYNKNSQSYHISTMQGPSSLPLQYMQAQFSLNIVKHASKVTNRCILKFIYHSKGNKQYLRWITPIKPLKSYRGEYQKEVCLCQYVKPSHCNGIRNWSEHTWIVICQRFYSSTN